MKRAAILTLFTLVCFFSAAQDSIYVSYYDANSKTYIATLKQQSEALEDNSVSNSSFKAMDIDGNIYNVIKIGNQYWMVENLRTTKFNDSTDIPLVSDIKSWSNLTSPGFCWYNNDAESYKTNYGALYNGYTVCTGKLCPTGWHIPGNEEWMTLINYCDEKIAGGKLKEIIKWINPNTGATNETGFKALPGGSRGNLGSFMDEGLRGHWWSFTENDKADIWNRTMSYSRSDVTGSYDHKTSGLSVRCVKNN